MIDYVKFKASDFETQEWSSLIKKEEVTIAKNGQYFIHNLRIRYYKNVKEVWVENSLHKYHNLVINKEEIGLNVNDFSRSDLVKTIDDISKVLGRDKKELKIFGRFEYGVNIDMGKKLPMEFINTCISVGDRQNEFFSIAKPGEKEFGKHTNFLNRKEKLYDKCKQIQQYSETPINFKNSILRYEVVLFGKGKVKSTLNLEVEPTLFDLTKKKLYLEMGNDIIHSFNRIKTVPIYEERTREEILDFMSYAHPLIVKYDKAFLNKYQFNRLRRAGKSKYSQYRVDKDSTHYKISRQIEEKVQVLTN